MSLEQKHCVPCEGGVEKLTANQIEELKPQVPEWEIKGEKLVRSLKFKNFAQALSFVNQVGEIAEKENHHPEIQFGYGHAEITLWTHAIGGLHENDFILASKIDQLNSGA